MAEIFPLRAVRYNPDKIQDLNAVIAPPYDQISESLQDELYGRSPYNFVRLILGKVFPGDSDHHSRYTRAAENLARWLREAVLVEEESPGTWVYEQRFVLRDGRSYTRTGLVALVKLEPPGATVLPHEQTFPKPKQDRLNLMRATRANLEHVFFLYDDPERRLEREVFHRSREGLPFLSCTDDLGTCHTLWRVAAENETLVRSFFRDRKLLIADGHHRYETSLTYREERLAEKSKAPPDAPFLFRLGTLVSLQDPGLVILPTHRVLKELPQNGFSLEIFSEYFNVEEIRDPKALLSRMEEKRHVFGLVLPNQLCALVLKDSFHPGREFPKAPPPLQDLDVFLLHRLVFDRLLRLPEGRLDEIVSYARWPEEVMGLIRSGSHRAAFLLNPVKPPEVFQVARSGEKMPHKSTDFYPKLWSGLLFYKMEP